MMGEPDDSGPPDGMADSPQPDPKRSDVIGWQLDLWKHYDTEIWKVFTILVAIIGVVGVTWRTFSDGDDGLSDSRGALVGGALLAGLSGTLLTYGYVLFKHRQHQNTVARTVFRLMKEADSEYWDPKEDLFGKWEGRPRQDQGSVVGDAIDGAIHGSAFFVVALGLASVLAIAMMLGLYLITSVCPPAGIMVVLAGALVLMFTLHRKRRLADQL